MNFPKFYRPPGVLCGLCASSSKRSLAGDNEVTNLVDRNRLFLSFICRDDEYESDDDKVHFQISDDSSDEEYEDE